MKKLLLAILTVLLPISVFATIAVPWQQTNTTDTFIFPALVNGNTQGILLKASSTLQNFTFSNATGTSATTTNFFATNASTTNLFGTKINGFSLTTCSGSSFLQWANGVFSCGTPAGGGTVTAVTGTWPITSSGGTTPNITWSGLASSTNLVTGSLLYSTGVNTFGQVATSTLTASSPLTGSFVQIGSSGSLGCQTASGSQAGCLSSADWTTFNGKDSFAWPFSFTSGNTYVSTSTNIGFLGNTGIFTTGSSTLNTLLVNSSTTLQNVTFSNATGTSATTTNFFSTNASTSKLFLATGTGCLSVTNGLVSANGSACGSGGAVAGSNQQIQYNNNGAFGASGDFLWDDVNKILSIATTSDQNSTIDSGGRFTINVGGDGEPFVLTTHAGKSAASTGGIIGLFPGNGSTTAAGGGLDFEAGNGSTNTTNGTGAGGTVLLTSGQGSPVGGAGGLLQIETGQGGQTSGSAVGGDIQFIAGRGGIPNGNGGNIDLEPGPNQGNGTNGQTRLYSNWNATNYGILDLSQVSSSNKTFTFPNYTGAFAVISTTTVGGLLGIGTSTPQWIVQIASSTGPQLTLSDTAPADNHISFRNYGGLFAIATSSPSTFATSSSNLVSFNVNGFPTFPAIRSSSGSNCLQTDTNGAITNTGSACGSGGGGTNTDKWATSTDNVSIYPNTATKVGVGTTSPFSTLSVSSTTQTIGTLPLFTVASTTNSTLFTVLGNGNVGVGISNPGVPLDVNGNIRVPDGAGFSTNGSVTGMTIDSIGQETGASNAAAFFNTRNIGAGAAVWQWTTRDSIGNTFTKLSVNNAITTGNGFTSYIGFSTSTPEFQVQINGNQQQLALTDDSSRVSGAWTLRNAGGFLYFATSSPTTFATSSKTALTIDKNGFLTLPADAGVGCGQFDANGLLTNTGTACGSGGGASNSKWATTTNLVGLTPNGGTTIGVVIGRSATTTNSLLEVNGTTTSANIIATSTSGFNGIGTTSIAMFSVAKPILNVNGTTTDFTNYSFVGTSACNGSIANQGIGFELCGSANSDAGGVQIQAGNNSNGTAAWSGLDLNNDRADNTLTHFAGFFLNSSGYTSTTYGTEIGQKNLALLQNTDGKLDIISSTSTNALNAAGIGIIVGGTTAGAPGVGNEVMSFQLGSLTGVGTTTPVFPFEISSSTAPQLTLDNKSAGTNAKHLTLDWTGTDLLVGTSSDTSFTSTTTALDLNTNSMPALGVGTTTATAQLTLGNYTQTNTIYGGASTTPFMWVGVMGSSTPSLAIDSPNNNGGVMIATTSTASTRAGVLRIGGRIYWSGSTNANTGDYICYNTLTGEFDQNTATCSLSSIRYKTDVNSLSADDSLTKVMALRPVSFYYNAASGKDTTKLTLGLIAEEVNKVVPQAVTYDQGQISGLDFNQFPAVMIGAIQAEQHEIDALKGGVASAEENWQWIAIGLLALWNVYLTCKKK